MPYADAYRLIPRQSGNSERNVAILPFDAVVLQDSPDGGTTWVNLPLRFTQVTVTGTAATNPYIIFKMVSISDAGSAGVVAATGGALGVNTPINVRNVRLSLYRRRHNPSNVSPSPSTPTPSVAGADRAVVITH